MNYPHSLASTPTSPSPQVVAEALYANAFAALEAGDGQAAARDFALMAGVVPLDPRAWVGLGTSLEQSGAVQRALSVYTLAQTFVPESIHCKLGRARTMARLGQRVKALALLDQAELLANETHDVALVDRMRGEL